MRLKIKQSPSPNTQLLASYKTILARTKKRWTHTDLSPYLLLRWRQKNSPASLSLRRGGQELHHRVGVSRTRPFSSFFTFFETAFHAYYESGFSFDEEEEIMSRSEKGHAKSRRWESITSSLQFQFRKQAVRLLLAHGQNSNLPSLFALFAVSLSKLRFRFLLLSMFHDRNSTVSVRFESDRLTIVDATLIRNLEYCRDFERCWRFWCGGNSSDWIPFLRIVNWWKRNSGIGDLFCELMKVDESDGGYGWLWRFMVVSCGGC